MSMACRERFLESAESRFNFERIVQVLGMSYEVQQISAHSSICWLLKDGKSVERGNGKGLGIQSVLSAQYEALEHYLAVSQSLNSDGVSDHSLSELEAGIDRAVLPLPFRECLQKNFYDVSLPWKSCAHIISGKLGYLPLIQVNPFLEIPKKDLLAKFCSNNGTAAGSNFNEAAIHGISEIIERDALSLFLYSSFVAQRHHVKLVKKNSIPRYLLELLSYAEKVHGDDLIILDITSDLGIPVFLASFTKQSLPIQPFGSGCSLNSVYALERAILEAIQAKEILDQKEIQRQKVILERFRRWPSFRRCAKMFLPEIADELQKEEFVSNNPGTSPQILFDMLVSNLQLRSIDIYTTVIFESEGFSCVKVTSPQLEQFHLCQHGYFTIPGERIRTKFKHDNKSR